MAESVAVSAEAVHVVVSEGPVSLTVQGTASNRRRRVATLSNLPQEGGTAGEALTGATWALGDGIVAPYEAASETLDVPNVPQFEGHNGYLAVVRAADAEDDVKGVIGFTLGGGSTGSVATVDATESYKVVKNRAGNAIGVRYRHNPSADTDEVRCVFVADQDVHDVGSPVVVDLWEWQSAPSGVSEDQLAAVHAHLAVLDAEFNRIHAGPSGTLPPVATDDDADTPNGTTVRLWTARVLQRLVRAVVSHPFIQSRLGGYVRSVTETNATLHIERVLPNGNVESTSIAITGAAQGAGITATQVRDVAGNLLATLTAFGYNAGTLTYTPAAPVIADGSIALAKLAEAVQDRINGAAALSQIRVEARADRPLTADQQADARERTDSAAADLTYRESRGTFQYRGGGADEVVDTGIDMESTDDWLRVRFKGGAVQRVSAQDLRQLPDVAVGGENVGVTGSAIEVDAGADVLQIAHRGARFYFGSGTVNDPGAVTVAAEGSHLKTYARKGGGPVADEDLPPRTGAFTVADEQKLDGLSKAVGETIGTGTVTAESDGDGYIAERRAGQTARGVFTGDANLVQASVDDAALVVGLTGTRADNDDAVIEIGSRRLHLGADAEFINETVPGVVTYTFVGNYQGWVADAAVRWTEYEAAGVVPEPDGPRDEGKVPVATNSGGYRLTDFPASSHATALSNLSVGLTLARTDTDTRRQAPAYYNPLFDQTDSALANAVLLLGMKVTVEPAGNNPNLGLEYGNVNATADQRSRWLSAFIPLSAIIAAAGYVSNTDIGGTKVFDVPFWTSTTSTGHFRVHVIKHASQGTGLFAAWEGEAGAVGATITADVQTTLIR